MHGDEVGYHDHSQVAVTHDRTVRLLAAAATPAPVTQLAYQPRSTAQVRIVVP